MVKRMEEQEDRSASKVLMMTWDDIPLPIRHFDASTVATSQISNPLKVKRSSSAPAQERSGRRVRPSGPSGASLGNRLAVVGDAEAGTVFAGVIDDFNIDMGRMQKFKTTSVAADKAKPPMQFSTDNKE